MRVASSRKIHYLSAYVVDGKPYIVKLRPCDLIAGLTFPVNTQSTPKLKFSKTHVQCVANNTKNVYLLCRLRKLEYNTVRYSRIYVLWSHDHMALYKLDYYYYYYTIRRPTFELWWRDVAVTRCVESTKLQYAWLGQYLDGWLSAGR